MDAVELVGEGVTDNVGASGVLVETKTGRTVCAPFFIYPPAFSCFDKLSMSGHGKIPLTLSLSKGDKTCYEEALIFATI